MDGSWSSEAKSYKLKMAVLSLTSASNFFLFLGIISSSWAYFDYGTTYMGLWRICTLNICDTHAYANYGRILLVVSFLVALVFNVFTALHLKNKAQILKRPTLMIGSMMLSCGLFELFGMVNITIIFSSFINYYSWSWGIFMGWIAVVLAVAAGSIGLYHHNLERKNQQQLQTPAPPTIETPPNTVIVS